jgi:hypothetical protein
MPIVAGEASVRPVVVCAVCAAATIACPISNASLRRFHLGRLPEGFEVPPDYNVAPTFFQPVVLRPADYDRWLSRETGERPPLDLLRPFDAEQMEAFPVDPRVGNLRNNEPGLCVRWECPANLA